MRIGVIGATRGIGRQVVEQALERGHEVSVLVRDAARLGEIRSDVTVIEGDIRSDSAVQAMLETCRTVCTSIGTTPTWRPVTVFSDGMRTVLTAMESSGVGRLVAVTGIGVSATRGHGGFLLERLALPLVLRRIYEDKDREEELIRKSAVDWTIVRPGFLTNGRRTGSYQVLVDLEGAKAKRISRADVAHFILDAVEGSRYLRQAVLLTY